MMNNLSLESCISAREGIFLGTFETLDHLQTGSSVSSLRAWVKHGRKNHPLLYCLYRDVWRGIQIIAPPYKDTQKNSPAIKITPACTMRT